MHKFKTQNIKGKQYVPVNERVLFFRNDGQYKGWSLTTELLHYQPEYCIVRASIKNAEGYEIASGIGHETPTSGQVNRTSMLENCETSAAGRALGLLGIGIETSIATFEEVERAISQQTAYDVAGEAPAKPTPTQKQVKEAVEGKTVEEAAKNLSKYTRNGDVWLQVKYFTSKDTAYAIRNEIAKLKTNG